MRDAFWKAQTAGLICLNILKRVLENEKNLELNSSSILEKQASKQKMSILTNRKKIKFCTENEKESQFIT